MLDNQLNADVTNPEQKHNEGSDSGLEEAKRAEIITNAQRKIDTGDKKHSDYPDWVQAKTTPKYSEEELREKYYKEFSKEQKAKKAIEKQSQDDAEFEKLKKEIPSDISQEKLDKMNSILLEEHKVRGTKAEALKYAMYKTGLSSTITEEMKKGIMIERKSLIPTGDYVQNKQDKKTELEKVEDKYMKNLPKRFSPDKYKS